MATSKPDRMRSAIRVPSISDFSPTTTDDNNSVTSADTSTGTSSSAKSIVASNRAAARINWLRHSSTNNPNFPDRTPRACLRCASVSASIKSARPSTCVRSRRLFSNARRVNSPGSASRALAKLPSTPRTARTTAMLPCKCNSTTSSPVKLLGAPKLRISAWSNNSPVRSRTSRKPDDRGEGKEPTICDVISCANGPETRTTETPARPGAVARAKIVSIFPNSLLSIIT